MKISLGYRPKSSAATDDGSIVYYDWEKKSDADKLWFTQFIRNRFSDSAYKLNFYGVFGKGRFVRNHIADQKIFFSGENLDRKFTKWNLLFGDYCLPYVDLSMGFGNIENDKYLRFPLWLIYVFKPDSNQEAIKKTIEKINCTRYPKNKECALIAGHDKHGTRKIVFEGLKDILQIDCAGRWNNNSTELWDTYNNEKLAYLLNFKFNICPENVNTKYYVTEKLFEAFMADAIPIYYGGNNEPELSVVNQSAIIFWNPKGDNIAARNLIKELRQDENAYQEFISQPKFLPNAVDYVSNKFSELENRLKAIIG